MTEDIRNHNVYSLWHCKCGKTFGSFDAAVRHMAAVNRWKKMKGRRKAKGVTKHE